MYAATVGSAVVIVIILLLIFIYYLKMKSAFENIYRELYGFKPKEFGTNVKDILLGRSLTCKVFDYQDRNMGASVSEAISFIKKEEPNV